MNYLGDVVLDSWEEDAPTLNVTSKKGEELKVNTLDVLVTKWAGRSDLALAVVNKDSSKTCSVSLSFPASDSQVKRSFSCALYNSRKF